MLALHNGIVEHIYGYCTCEIAEKDNKDKESCAGANCQSSLIRVKL